MNTVIIKSVPNALAMFIPVLALMIIEKFSALELSLSTRNSIAMAVITVVGFVNLVALCRPFTKWRVAVVSIVAACLIIVVPVSIYAFGDYFHLMPIKDNWIIFGIMLSVGLVWAIILQVFRGRIEAVIERRLRDNPLNFPEFKPPKWTQMKK